MPPSAGGVNTTGPGQFAPSAGNSQMPNFGAREPQYANLGGPLGRRAAGGAGGLGDQMKPIGRILDPAGIGRGNLTDFKGGFLESARSTLDPAGVFGSRDHDPKDAKGVLDPAAGTFTIKNYGKNNAAISAAATEFLRTGRVPSSLKHAEGAFKDIKHQIRQQLNSGGPGGGAWQWGTPSAGAPTTIPGQGPINWGQQPGQGAPPPAAGAPPPAAGAPPSPMPPYNPGASPYVPPQQGQPWTRPAALPSPDPYKAQQIAALRAPNAQSRLVPPGGAGQ
jgi:hypothetical protein